MKNDRIALGTRAYARPRTLAYRFEVAIASLFAAIAVSAAVSVPAVAESQQRAAEVDDGELIRELEEAQRREAEIVRREAEREAVKRRRIVENERQIAEENEARLRSKEEALQQQIAREIEMQDEMLRRRERNESAQTRDLLGAHAESKADGFLGETAASLAPDAPELRDLPRAIFSEEKISVAPRTPGFDNEKTLKLSKLTLDADRDGKPEVVRYVLRDTKALVRQEEDRDYDGKIDSVLRFERGAMTAHEIDTNRDGRPDIWERYKNGRQIERTLDRDYDGTVDAFYEFEGQYLALERHDTDNNGKVDLRIQYEKGRRASAEEDTDRDGRVDTWIRYGLADGRETVTRIELDKSGRGFADTFESFEARAGKSVLARREEDLDGDGEIDIVSIYRLGKLVRREILKPEVVKL